MQDQPDMRGLVIGSFQLYGGRAAPSCRILDRAPGHPDKGMKPAVGEVLEAFNLLEAGQHRPLFPHWNGSASPADR
jgi:hypothetical protein